MKSLKTDEELLETAKKILELPNAEIVVAGLLKEIELLRLPREPAITGIPVGEIW